jgi:hypothetical protein
MQLNGTEPKSPLRVLSTHGDHSVAIEVDGTRLALTAAEAQSVAEYIGSAAAQGLRVMPWPDFVVGELPSNNP